MQVSENHQTIHRDLIVGEIYRFEDTSGTGQLTGEPLSTLLGVGNVGGFRPKLKQKNKSGDYLYVVLTSTTREPEWPDCLDKESGVYTYFGDNRSSDKGLHATKGNTILRDTFLSDLDNNSEIRRYAPLFFIFESTGNSRDFEFKGVGIPGINGFPVEWALEAVWRTKGKLKFQNYRARFTLLNCKIISGKWLEKARNLGYVDYDDENAPKELVDWVESGNREPLISNEARRSLNEDDSEG